MDADARVRAAIEEHWRASEAGQTAAEHAIYAEDAILDPVVDERPVHVWLVGRRAADREGGIVQRGRGGAEGPQKWRQRTPWVGGGRLAVMVAWDREDRRGVRVVRGEELGPVVGLLTVRVDDVTQVVEEVDAFWSGQVVGHRGGHVPLGMLVPPAAGVPDAVEPQGVAAGDIGQ